MSTRSLGSLLLVSTLFELAIYCTSYCTSYCPSYCTWVLPGCASRSPAVSLFVHLALQTVLLFGLPVAWLKLVDRARLAVAGLAFPPARMWVSWILPVAAVTIPIALIATRIPAIHAAYPRLAEAHHNPWLLVPSTIGFATYGLSWEFFFRGFLQTGLSRHIGRWALVVQAIPCGLMHWGKPLPELVASFPAAVVFGAIAYQTGSVIPGWLLHVFIALTINLGCILWPL